MIPSRFLEMIASSEESTIAASRNRSSSGLEKAWTREAGGEPVRPAGRGGLSEEPVMDSSQTSSLAGPGSVERINWEPGMQILFHGHLTARSARGPPAEGLCQI